MAENTLNISANVLMIKQYILLLRGRRVIIDVDLAKLYGTTTKRLNEQVKRNRARFPDDFMFILTKQEKEQVVANCDHLSKLNIPVHYLKRSQNMVQLWQLIFSIVRSR